MHRLARMLVDADAADNLSASLLFSIIHRRPLAFGYLQEIGSFLSMAVHKRPFTFVPIRIFC